MNIATKPSSTDLSWLLGAMLLAMALHFGHFPVWISALIVFFMGWRLMLQWKSWAMPRLWLLLPITLLGVAGIYLQHRTLFGRDASVALLALMLALKLMESSTRRDYFILIFAGYFLTITAFLFNQSLLVGAYLLLPVFGLTACLVGISYPHGTLSSSLRARLGAGLLLQAIPIMLLLFLLFPRIPGPLWGVPQDAYRAMSGLGDHMQPGDISELSLSGAVAFRVQFQGEAPPQPQLYWRGPVLWHFDGRGWQMASRGEATENLEPQGRNTDYTVTLEPHNRRWMLMLDIPHSVPPGAYLSRERQVIAQAPIRTRIRYTGSSYTQYQLEQGLSSNDLALALQLPPGGNPKSRALAQTWKQELQSPQRIINAAMTMFREQGFFYTLTPPLLGIDTIDDFLFNSRRGFCEHYASSFAYLMRAAGIPARVVTGYQGGEINPAGRYLIVRQSDAHAWVEVWLEGQGWVRLDPTAAVAPSRVDSGINSALPDNTLLPILARPDYPWLRKLYLNWDALNNGWNQWVLGYNQQRQIELLARLTGSTVNWQHLILWLTGGLVLIVVLLCLVLFRHKRMKTDPVQQLYRRYLAKLARHGIKASPHEGALSIQQRASTVLPQHVTAIVHITQLYLELRYGAHADGKTMAELRLSIESLDL
ncbi:DUF3488 and transglutaminase-like domain-containing protein [Methylobacillus arboreus]|uniref:transglutaminase TgpA family protein n=1 Tax=Methylobacillus arboreus TaxID=755170 RepID=UPI001E43F3F6|nr:DUF3488 and transglutaminase-like domain-containing protein [Methylobacillus arboreus]MCB5189431.1 DUF3488 and transglutaminase-like domain-containing protein [Methylobacillus arboreus]